MERKTILVVEDNALNMKLFRTLLQMGRFRVLEAQNAELGLQFAREEKPDLILMDVQLPGMDGLAATCILKQDPSTQKIPVVALTSYAMEGDREKAKAAGCDDYITKPIDTREFLNKVRKLVQNGHDPHLQPFVNARYRKRILIVDDEPRNVKLLEAQIPRDLCAIDDFPELLNSRGTEAGNYILQEVGHLLKRNFREVDLPVHLGEELFSEVLPYTNGSGAIQVAKRVREIIQGHSFLQKTPGPSVQIHLSMGIALYSSPDLTVDQFIQKADDSLFQARTEGKGRIWIEDKPSPPCGEEKDF